MTYVFPPSLHPLRDYMRNLGADTIAFVSARQAAFMAQQLLGTRVKFPPKGADMTSTLFLIQKAVTEGKALKSTADQIIRGGKKPKGKKKDRKPANSNRHHRDFSPEVFAEGVHIFCDGAAVPNPGVGGWGVVVYRDGIEVETAFGGDADITNNQMELTALLKAIETAKKPFQRHRAAGGLVIDGFGPVTIWSDSKYTVDGANIWRRNWKRNGWKKSAAATEHVKNVELWKAIDEALEDAPKFGDISIKWVKGHAGITGNERADELAEQGRAIIPEQNNTPTDDLDAQYRAIMAG